MEGIRSYILSVTAAAMLCALITSLAGKGSSVSVLIKLLAGVVMAAVVISPVAEMTTVNLGRYLDTLNLDAMAAVEAGTKYAQEETRGRIKDQLESYILDKAAQLSLDINVELVLDEETMVPVSAVVDGPASPHARAAMEAILRDDLGIPAEAVRWN